MGLAILRFGEALDLAVLDSTDPGAVLAYDAQLDLGKTVFIVSTKSGTTAESLAFQAYQWGRVAEALKAELDRMLRNPVEIPLRGLSRPSMWRDVSQATEYRRFWGISLDVTLDERGL